MPTYPGGKAGEGVYHWLISQMPPHDTFVEGFLGQGAVTRNKRPAASTIGIEIDGEVLSAWRGDEVPNLRLVQGSALTRLRAMRHWLDASCMVYLDPPYLMETRRFERQYYRHEFGTREEHEELLWVVSELRCPVMLSGYWSELYAERLKGWRTASLVTTTRGAVLATEWVWMNYPEPLELHDYRYLGAGYRERERIRKRQRRWRAKLQGMSTLERYALLATLEDLRSTTAGNVEPRDPPDLSMVATIPGGGSGMRTSPPERAVRDRRDPLPLETARITAGRPRPERRGEQLDDPAGAGGAAAQRKRSADVKAILCGLCSDIRALPRGTEPVSCSCGNVTGWWVLPGAGIAQVRAIDRSAARIIGIHNGFLQAAFEPGSKGNEYWREVHERVTAAPGYLFDQGSRGCPVVIIVIGQSNDVTWAPDEEPS